MNEEMMELLMQSAMELMEPTRTRLREQNTVFEEGRSVCGELEKKFDEAVEALRNLMLKWQICLRSIIMPTSIGDIRRSFSVMCRDILTVCSYYPGLVY